LTTGGERVQGVDLAELIRTILYLLFGALTAALAAVIGPTYDNLLVPELSPQALYPEITASGSDPTNYLAPAAHFSTYLLVNVVDPAVSLVGLGIALAYLSKVWVSRWAATLDGLLPRLILAVLGANFTVPIAGAILGVAGGLYPVVAGWDGGAWQQWVHLAGWGEVSFSWDNGALAFVLALVEFAAVFALLLAVGLRDALLAVLIVVLPILTLLWPFRPLSPLARRAWFLFGELAFLPCVLVIPLELAVNSPNPVLLVGYLAAAVGSPYLLSIAGAQLGAFGFPSGSATVQSGAQRGLATSPRGASGFFGPGLESVRSRGSSGRAAWSATRVAGSAAAPAAVPLAVADALGSAGLHLARHLHRARSTSDPASGWRPIRGGGTG
jgi:hypothetical protein